MEQQVGNMDIKKVCLIIVLFTIAVAVGAGMFGMYRGDINPDTVTSEYSSGKAKINVPTSIVEVMRQAKEKLSPPDESTDDYEWNYEEEHMEHVDEEGEEEEGTEDESTDEEADTGETEEPSENFGQDIGYWQKKINNSPQRKENNIMSATKYGNKEYYLEWQTAGPWGSYKATSGSYVKNAGCMLYAAAIASSNKTGKLVTVKDIITGMGYDVNYSNGYLNTGAKKLPAVGHNPGAGVSWQKALQAGGIDGTEGHSATDTLNAVKSGSMVIVHENTSKSNAMLSCSGQHWYTIAGYSNGKYLVLSSSKSKSGWLDAGLVERSVKTSNHNIIIK